jgi:hypothetical protein
MLGLLLDGAIALGLLAVVGLGLRLKRNLASLRSGDGELERLVVALDGATERSAAALHGLKQAAATAEGRLAAIQRLVDDLQFLTGRGEQLADRLEEQIRRGRPLAQRAEPPARAATDPPRAPRQAGVSADLERTLSTLR